MAGKRISICVILVLLTMLCVLYSVTGALAANKSSIDLIERLSADSITAVVESIETAGENGEETLLPGTDPESDNTVSNSNRESESVERVFRLPAGLLEIADDAFDDDWNVTIASEENTEAQAYAVRKGYQWKQLVGLSVFRLPEGLQIIGDDAFTGTAAEAVILPDTVAEIGDRAFAGMPRLIAINIPKSTIVIGNNLFDSQQQVMIFGSAGSWASRYAASAGYPFVPVDALPFDQSRQMDVEQHRNADASRTDEIANTPALHLNIRPTEVAVGDISTSVYDQSIAFCSQGRAPPLVG